MNGLWCAWLQCFGQLLQIAGTFPRKLCECLFPSFRRLAGVWTSHPRPEHTVNGNVHPSRQVGQADPHCKLIRRLFKRHFSSSVDVDKVLAW